MSKIFGGTKSKSTSQQTSSSSNLAYPQIQQDYGAPAAGAFKTGLAAIDNELGGGFDTYKANTGMDFFSKLGLNRVGGGFSGRGAFQSGAALQGLAEYDNNLKKASYNDYLDKLFQKAQLGVQGGGLVAGAGQVSQSQGTSESQSRTRPNIFSDLVKVASAVAASDRRLKTNIEKIGELENGLGVYTYDYISGKGPYTGVMADEVAKVMPEALGPVVSGYMTVDYSKLRELEVVDGL